MNSNNHSSPIYRTLFAILILITVLTVPHATAFQVQKIKDETLPEQLKVPNLENCDVSMGGWVIVLRCLDSRLMVSDLQSWTDPYLDAPKVYWKKTIEQG